MTNYTYKQIQTKAKECIKNMKNYKTGIGDEWSYYFAKSTISPKKDIKKISIKSASNRQQDSISRGISKKDYTELAKRFVAYVEKHKQLPNYITYKNLKISPYLLKAFFAKIIVNNYPATQNINSKWFTKPVEYPETVYNNFTKKTGKKPKTLDETLTYVSNYMNYEGYFDDKKSNDQVINSKAGNCVDLLQWLINMAKAEGYECKCIHVQCRSSGTGHVFGKFKHKKYTENTWITRDPAAVAGGHDIHKVWCSDGIKLAENPSWFMQNLNR